MIRGKRQIFHGVLDIPEGKIGKFIVRHLHEPPGKTFPLATSRTAILGGDQRGSVTFAEPTRWHELLGDGWRWMTDWPIEQVQHDRELKPMRGAVLVGGLGLGYAATVLATRRSIEKVVVVEKALEVVRLVGPYVARGHYGIVPGKVEIVCADLFEFLKTTTERFDWGFYDIWADDSESTFFETVCPLRRLSDGKVRQVVCWNENVMRGQLFFSLQGRLHGLSGKLPGVPPDGLERLCAPTKSIWIDWSVPFFRWVRDRQPSEPVAQRGAEVYAGIYGLDLRWEERWQVWQEVLLKDRGGR